MRRQSAIVDSRITGYRAWTDGAGNSHESHATLVSSGSRRILVGANETSANDADGLQCQENVPALPVAADVTVQNNHFHANGENAVDVKRCRNVTVRGNRFHGYRGKQSAPQGMRS